MCGIAGIYSALGEPVDGSKLDAMGKRLGHRGPDAGGTAQTVEMGMVHRRLKIIDLSDQANQPMQDREHGLIIVYNGEVYNYVELRKELEKRNRQFKTASDTEVILNAYLEWGLDCLRFFNGMFAFALWDKTKQRLFCARDRLGVKPFYYYWNRKWFAFASEIKALLCLPYVSVKANEIAIHDYLAMGLADHGDDTFFGGIEKLPSGSYLVVDAEGIRIRKYWDFEVSSHVTRRAGFFQEAEQVRTLLTDAVQLRLRSDVPVGSCLSGGIDSTSIVCLINAFIAPEHKKRIGDYQKTYSAVFPNTALDESSYIQEVIASTNAEAKRVEPSPWGFLDELNDLLWHQEEPFTSSSVYAQWSVFRAVRESKVKVVLDGQGADEQLCGYRKFAYFFFRELAKRGWYRRMFRESLLFLKNFMYFRDVDFRNSLRYFPTLSKWYGISTITKEGWEHQGAQRPLIGYLGSLAQRIKQDLTKYSLPALLRYEDKNSMAFSVESRTPYLDFRLVEYLAGLPLDAKVGHGWPKYILRQAMKGIIPESIRLRKDKLAFDTPQDSWIRTHWKDTFIRAYRANGLLNEFVDRQKLLEQFVAFLHRKSWLSGNFFFRAFILQKWSERFSLVRT
jgi:asparagine synthase (glutamine-hydrolysing)